MGHHRPKMSVPWRTELWGVAGKLCLESADSRGWHAWLIEADGMDWPSNQKVHVLKSRSDIAEFKIKGLRIAEIAIPTIYADEISHLKPIQYGLNVLSVIFAFKFGKYDRL